MCSLKAHCIYWTYLMINNRREIEKEVKQATCWLDLPGIESTNKRANELTNDRTNEKAITLMFLCEKKQRNMWKKSKENLQKRRFAAYFRHFWPEKNFSRKSDKAMFWAFIITERSQLLIYKILISKMIIFWLDIVITSFGSD